MEKAVDEVDRYGDISRAEGLTCVCCEYVAHNASIPLRDQSSDCAVQTSVIQVILGPDSSFDGKVVVLGGAHQVCPAFGSCPRLQVSSIITLSDKECSLCCMQRTLAH